MILVQGLVAGAAHALTGPDHLAGVAPLALDHTTSRHSALVGATWGLGHGLGVALLGILGQTVLEANQIEFASYWAERLVGILLILIGIVSLRKARGLTANTHVHSHAAQTRVDSPAEDIAATANAPQFSKGSVLGDTPRPIHRHTALGIGVVHGLAGAGHFWAVLPSLAMGPTDAALYIGGYVTMSLVAMATFGLLLSKLTAAFGARAVPHVMAFAGLASILVGGAWLLHGLGAA